MNEQFWQGDAAAMARILVIEDENLLLRDILEILQFSDFEALGASNGEDGIDLAEERAPDLILCDIGLRGKNDGFDVLDHVRQSAELAAKPFVFMSARADQESKTVAYEKGANDYLTKPFAAADLIETIERLLA